MTVPLLLPAPREVERFGFHSRLLHHWRANDLHLSSLAGTAATLTRAGDGTADDALGVLRTCGHSQSRWTGWDLDGDGVADLPALLLERATPTGGNLVGASEAIQADATRWPRTGTPTFGTAHTKSGITLDLIGDNDGAAQEYVSQNLAFTGNAQKAIRIRVKRGLSPAAAGAQIQLRDTTAGVDRLLSTIQFNADGTLITPTPSVGTLLLVRRRADLTYDLWFRTSSVTAANTNQLRIIPAGTATQQGDLYAGGVQAENALVSSSYVKNAAAAGGTRLADVLSWSFLARPQPLTLYVSFVELGTLVHANGRVVVIASAALGTPYLYLYSTGSFYRLEYHNGSASAQATLGAAPAFGDRVELRAVLNADGSIVIGQSINEGTETTASAAAPASGPALPTAWSAQTLWLNGEASANAGLALYRALKVAAGVRSLDDCRRRLF
jgi:hypothetical protein